VLIIGLLGAIVFGIAVGLVNGVIIAKYCINRSKSHSKIG
jgi:ribose/xylose/arabinose/galactoside ABC-type transport system permease subunit